MENPNYSTNKQRFCAFGLRDTMQLVPTNPDSQSDIIPPYIPVNLSIHWSR